MDVEFEEVEEGVVEGGDGAVDGLFTAVAQLERAAGLVASWEGDVDELAFCVGDLRRALAEQRE